MTGNNNWNSPLFWSMYGLFSYVLVIALGLAIDSGLVFVAVPPLIALIAVITAHFRTAPVSAPRNVAAYVGLLVVALGLAIWLMKKMMAYPFDLWGLFNHREFVIFSLLSAACVYGVIASSIKLTAAFLDWYLRSDLR